MTVNTDIECFSIIDQNFCVLIVLLTYLSFIRICLIILYKVRSTCLQTCFVRYVMFIEYSLNQYYSVLVCIYKPGPVITQSFLDIFYRINSSNLLPALSY